MSKGRALVFGGSGFLGSHVADALISDGYDVIIFDRDKSPYLDSTQSTIIGDITNLEDVGNAVRGVDYVYHYAGMADIREANDNPIEAVKYNVLGTANILQACINNQIKRFVYASTVYVYSEQGGIYRSTKQASEMLIENYSNLFGLDFTVLRFGSLYGGRANNFNSVHNMIRQALVERKIRRVGDGNERREYIHVKDAARASVDLLDDRYRNEYLILTGMNSITIKNLIHMISEMLGDTVDVEYVDEHVEEHYQMTPYSFRPRIARKYAPVTQYDLGQGILDTIYEVYKEIDKNTGDTVINLPE